MFWTALVVVILSAAATLLGILLVQRFEPWIRERLSFLSTFAAGVLVTIAVALMMPRAFEASDLAPFMVVAGYVALLLFEQLVTGRVYEAPKAGHVALGAAIVPVAGIALHSFVDGLIHSVTFNEGLTTGLGAALGMILHEVPEGMLVYAFLLRSAMGRLGATLAAFAAAGLTTPVGMVLSYSLISEMSEAVRGALLAASSGALLYVGATHLLPEARFTEKRLELPTFAAGAALAAGIVLLSH